MPRICPSCGALEGEKKFAGVFCIDCRAKKISFEQPKLPDLKRCANCQRVFLGGQWVAFNERQIASWLATKIKGSEKLEGVEAVFEKVKTGFVVHTKMFFEVAGQQVEKRANLTLRLATVSCEECIKTSGGYHEAVIQLRGEDRERLEKLAEKITKEVLKNSNISGTESRKEGIDILVVDKRGAMKAVQSTRKEFTTTHKLIGMKQGKRIYRASLCIRI